METMKTYAIYMWPRSSLASTVGSDTLFGAICWAIRLLELADVGQMLANFDPPRFVLGQPFPVYRAGDVTLHFYLRPAWVGLSPRQVTRLAETERRQTPTLSRKKTKLNVVRRAKDIGSVRLVSEKLFCELVLGQTDAAAVLTRLKSGEVERVGGALVTRDERRQAEKANGKLAQLLTSEAVQHNQVDRVAGATVEGLLFYDEETCFAQGVGLWALLRTSSNDVDDLIRPALRYLADTGLGANRTTGKGHFDFEVTPVPSLPDAGDDANGWVSLSRYVPADDELPIEGAPLAYRLSTLWAKREQKFARPAPGRAAPPIYKRRLRAFDPGALFPLKRRKPVYGRLVPVVSAEDGGWTVYQSGLALPVFARVTMDDEAVEKEAHYG